MIESYCQVAVVGAGPSGLSAATELRRLGVDDVVVLERESAGGGIPRHCGHSPFGMREFHRILSGPAYARRLVSRALDHGVDLRLATTVVEIGAEANLVLTSDRGIEHLSAQRIVVCTGNREQPRSVRLVSGSRPLGIVTTGALQVMTQLKNRVPFRRPLIVGSELVSFSALLTCRQFGIRPLAMLEREATITAGTYAALLPRLLATPLLTGTSIEAIHGHERVSSVDIRNHRGELERLECDGVIFSGSFVAESSLLRAAGFEIDAASNGPLLDQLGRSSDPRIFACGNLLHPVDTAGWCWAEGRRVAQQVYASLKNDLAEASGYIEIENASPLIRYFTPQRLAVSGAATARGYPGMQMRFSENRRGTLRLRSGDRVLVQRRLNARRERRVLLPLPDTGALPDGGKLVLEFEPG